MSLWQQTLRALSLRDLLEWELSFWNNAIHYDDADHIYARHCESVIDDIQAELRRRGII